MDIDFLLETRENLELIFNTIPDAVLITRLTDGCLVHVNDGFLALTGLTRAEVIGKTSLEINMWKSPEELEKLVNSIKETGVCENLESFFQRKDGRQVICIISARVLVLKGVPHILAVTHDITERKRTENALKESEAKFRSLYENMSEGSAMHTLVYDDQGVPQDYLIMEVNPAFEAQLGILRETVINKTSKEVYGVDDPPYLDIYSRVALTGNPEVFETYFAPQGKYFSISVYCPYKGSFATIFKNITDHRNAELELGISVTKYRVLFDILPIGITISDSKGQIIESNQIAEKLLGISRAEQENRLISGTEWRIIRPDESVMPVDEYASVRALREGRRVENAVMGIVKDNNEVNWISVSAAPIPLEDYGVAIVYSDITELKNGESILLKTIFDAEMANNAKSIFLANISHEIRTPLNAIIGFSQLMNRDKSLSEIQKEYNASIIRAGEHLLTLINDILELAKVEAGRVVLNPANVDLRMFFKDIQLIFKERAQSKKLRFVFEISENLPRHVVIDESKLRQIFINLIDNAIKFTDEGVVNVLTSYMKEANGHGKLIVEIQDSGTGIAEDELVNLFKPFVQTTTGIKKGSGTGLGLALSRELAMLMGGNITVTSAVGKGSLFTLHVALEEGHFITGEVNATKHVVGLAKSQKFHRILVADDMPENLQTVVSLLRMVGFETNEAVNGKDALDKFEQWVPDLIIMDLRMPVMDGFEATLRLRSTEKGAKTPVIALSASTFEDDRKRIEEIGIQDFISKPFRENDLFHSIGKVLGISYIYEDETSSEQLYLNDEEVIASNVKQLPEVLRLKMLETLGVADIRLLKKLINSMDQNNSSLAKLLMTLARNYDYDRLKMILTKKHDEH